MQIQCRKALCADSIGKPAQRRVDRQARREIRQLAQRLGPCGQLSGCMQAGHDPFQRLCREDQHEKQNAAAQERTADLLRRAVEARQEAEVKQAHEHHGQAQKYPVCLDAHLVVQVRIGAAQIQKRDAAHQLRQLHGADQQKPRADHVALLQREHHHIGNVMVLPRRLEEHKNAQRRVEKRHIVRIIRHHQQSAERQKRHVHGMQRQPQFLFQQAAHACSPLSR